MIYLFYDYTYSLHLYNLMCWSSSQFTTPEAASLPSNCLFSVLSLVFCFFASVFHFLFPLFCFPFYVFIVCIIPLFWWFSCVDPLLTIHHSRGGLSAPRPKKMSFYFLKVFANEWNFLNFHFHWELVSIFWFSISLQKRKRRNPIKIRANDNDDIFTWLHFKDINFI